MKEILEDDYSGLIKIVEETIRNGMKSVEAASFFPMAEFRDKMEVEFTKLGFRERESAGVENILILSLAAVGDLTLTTPAIREIRMNYPSAHITLVVSPQAYSMAVLCPYANEVIPCFDSFEVNKEKKLLQILGYCTDFAKKYLWKKRYQLGFSLRYFYSEHLIQTLLMYLSGARERVGYVSRALCLYTDGVAPPEKNPGNILLNHPVINPKEIIHNASRILYLLQHFGLKVRNTDLELWYDASDLCKVNQLTKNFAPGRLKISLAINANIPARKYPARKLLPALEKIISEGAAIIIFGGPDEAEDAKFLQENLPGEYVLNLTEILPGRRAEAALISKTDLYLGNCTGTLDIASAARLPSIVLSCEPKTREQDMWAVSFYSTFYPYQTEALVIRPEKPLEDCKYGGFLFEGCGGGGAAGRGKSHCITQIEPEEIISAYHEMIHFMKNSRIKKSSCPQILRIINHTAELGAVDKL